MKPILSIVTLGVKDLQKSKQFYRDGLGWKTSAKEDENIVFFKLNSIVLALYSYDKLAEGALVKPDGSGFSGITFAHNVGDEKEVDEVLETAQKAGAKIIKNGQKVFWGGYSGYFADPDGYLWEVAYNPFWKLDSEGNPFYSG